MDIRMIGMHVNGKFIEKKVLSDEISAKVYVGYTYPYEQNKASLNYDINIIYNEEKLLNIKCSYLIFKEIVENDLKETLNMAIEQLQDRIEVIVGLVCEEKGLVLV